MHHSTCMHHSTLGMRNTQMGSANKGRQDHVQSGEDADLL